MHTGKLVLIIGPSGVGKSAILQKLRHRHPEYVFPRSATTRSKRDGETDLLYHFISEDDFTKWIDQNKFLEWAQVHKGARYGTLIEEIIPPIESGKIVIREVDVQGFDSMRKHPLFSGEHADRLQTIFILPESTEQLIKRIKNRAPIDQEELDRRIASMKKELDYAKDCDISIVNADDMLDDTIANVEKAIVNS